MALWKLLGTLNQLPQNFAFIQKRFPFVTSLHSCLRCDCCHLSFHADEMWVFSKDSAFLYACPTIGCMGRLNHFYPADAHFPESACEKAS